MPLSSSSESSENSGTRLSSSLLAPTVSTAAEYRLPGGPRYPYAPPRTNRAGVHVGRGTETEAAAATTIAGAAAARGDDAAPRAVARAIEACGEPPGLVLAFPSGLEPVQVSRE